MTATAKPKLARRPARRNPREIFLTRDQAVQFVAFGEAMGLDQFFIAKDEGAYVGMTKMLGGKLRRIIHYFQDCNPATEPDTYWETQQRLFGGDDFGEHLPLRMIHDALKHEEATFIGIKVTTRTIVCTPYGE